jgi:uncharacterized damage-inducible protein DinB
MILSHLRRLHAHMVWADGRVLSLLPASIDAEPLRLFAHVLAAERVWLARLEGRDGTRLEIWPSLGVEECARLAEEMRTGYTDYLDALEEGRLTEPITYRNSAGVEFRTEPLDVLTQVFLHGSYHRGQIVRSLRQSGGEPVGTDYIIWAREQG